MGSIKLPVRSPSRAYSEIQKAAEITVPGNSIYLMNGINFDMFIRLNRL